MDVARSSSVCGHRSQSSWDNYTVPKAHSDGASVTRQGAGRGVARTVQTAPMPQSYLRTASSSGRCPAFLGHYSPTSTRSLTPVAGQWLRPCISR